MTKALVPQPVLLEIPGSVQRLKRVLQRRARTRRSVRVLGVDEWVAPGRVVGASRDLGLVPQGDVAVVAVALGRGLGGEGGTEVSSSMDGLAGV